ncbi:MAG: hypothetical protein ABI083_13720 [Lapillicoccus sp.]
MAGLTGLAGMAGMAGLAGAMGPVLTQALGLCAGVVILTAVLQLWRRSLSGSLTLLAAQGVALSALILTIGVADGDPQLLGVAVLVLAIKGAAIPLLLARAVSATGARPEVAPRMNPTAGLLLSALLTTVAYLASRPIIGPAPDAAGRAVPVGLAVVLIGFLMLLARRQAISQLVGFVVLDNGIATVALLTAGGVPLVVELGVTLDVLLVVLILRVLTGRLRQEFGATDLDDLTELRD